MTDNYYELTIKPQTNYELFLDLVATATNDAIEEHNGSLIIRSENSLEELKKEIENFSENINTNCEVQSEIKKNIDWVKQYQQSVSSVEIGNFFIRPSWEEKKDDKIDIIIDPALSFGSGHHETTAACIEFIDKYAKPGLNVLDVGTGSGILAVGAAKKGCAVDICDTDEVCIADTTTNFKLNNVTFEKSWIGSANLAINKYNLVIANIVADVLSMIANDLKKCLQKDGLLIISGILDKHLSRVQSRFKDLHQLELIHKGEWVSIVYKNKE
ncbi:MAG: 50S ribosomal protein L11 methyltransferase [Campylobacterota bacterium]